MGWRGRTALACAGVAAFLLGTGAVARLAAPVSNTQRTRFDAILVLGTPADGDGNPTPEMLARVNEGVREYERGVAPRLIMSGGAAHNEFVEARVMARTAEAEGIPETAILVEPQARDTIQNACYSWQMMQAHGWQSAEVVSNPAHLPRAAMILSRLPMEWRTHTAPPVEPESAAYRWAASSVEVLKTVRYLVWTRWSEPCAP